MNNAVQKMGLPYPPSYLNPRSQGPVILQGLNYGSAGSGILDSTGYDLVSFFADFKPSFKFLV